MRQVQIQKEKHFLLPKAPVIRMHFHLKRNDIVADSPPVYPERMKTIMKTETFEYAIQSESILKRNEMKTELFEPFYLLLFWN